MTAAGREGLVGGQPGRQREEAGQHRVRHRARRRAQPHVRPRRRVRVTCACVAISGN